MDVDIIYVSNNISTPEITSQTLSRLSYFTMVSIDSKWTILILMNDQFWVTFSFLPWNEVRSAYSISVIFSYRLSHYLSANVIYLIRLYMPYNFWYAYIYMHCPYLYTNIYSTLSLCTQRWIGLCKRIKMSIPGKDCLWYLWYLIYEFDKKYLSILYYLHTLWNTFETLWSTNDLYACKYTQITNIRVIFIRHPTLFHIILCSLD